MNTVLFWKSGDGENNLEQFHFVPRGNECPCAGGVELPQAGLKGFTPTSLSLFL